MFQSLGLMIIGLAMASLSAMADPASTLTSAQAKADLRLMRRALEEAHPGLYRYSSKTEINSAFERLEQKVDQPITDVELYGQISLLLATIRCDHTKAEFSDTLTKFRQNNPTHLPFRFKLFEGRMYIFASDLLQSPLVKGTEIISINGKPISELIKQLEKVVSIDGFTEPSRNAKLEADSDLMGSDFDQFYPIFYGFPKEFKLEVISPGAQKSRLVVLQPITFVNWVKLPWTSTPYRDEFYKAITWKTAANKTALLRVDTFVNYRNPVDALLFYSAFFKAMKTEKIEHLILDLRENGGGSNDATIALAAHLLDKPFVWNKPIFQKAIRFGDWIKNVQTWGDPKKIFEPPLENFIKRSDGWYEHVTGPNTPEQLPMQPAPEHFTGRVTVLIGPQNSSGSTMLIAKLKDEKRITTVGTATGGSAEGPTAGRLFFLKLPASGIVVRIPNYWNRMNIASFEPGKGVAPDLEVQPTLTDFLADQDPAMKWAQALPKP